MATGTVHVLSVTEGNNYGFRVYLNGVSNACTGGPEWAYLNKNDRNYKTYVAALMSAKALGSTVTIYSTLVGGYCHIGYLVVI